MMKPPPIPPEIAKEKRKSPIQPRTGVFSPPPDPSITLNAESQPKLTGTHPCLPSEADKLLKMRQSKSLKLANIEINPNAPVCPDDCTCHVCEVRRQIEARPAPNVASETEIFLAYRKNMRVPKSLAGCTFESFRKPIAPFKHRDYDDFLNDVVDWTNDLERNMQENSGHSLYLGGATGIGKSHLAVAAVKAAMMLNLKGRFIDVPHLLAQLRKWGAEQDLGQFYEHPLLLLDDLGASEASKGQIELFRVILRKRIADRLPTIVTSNLHFGSEIADMLGDATFDRMRESYKIVQPPITDSWREAETQTPPTPIY